MKKLTFELLNKLIEQNCTSNEIQFIIYSLNRSDAYGRVQGLNYRDVAQALNITERDFYYILNNLDTREITLENEFSEEHRKDAGMTKTTNAKHKGIISVDWTNGKDWNITINYSVVTSSQDYSKGYININRAIFSSTEFRREKGNVKLIILLLMKVCRDNKFRISIEKLGAWVGVATISTINRYVESLKKYFRISISEKGVLSFDMQKDKFVKNVNSDDEGHIKHKIIMFCKQFNIHYTIEDLKDLIILFKQFGRSWRKIFYAIYETTRKNFLVQPRLINHVMSTLKQT